MRGPAASTAQMAKAAAVGRLRREKTTRYGLSQARKLGRQVQGAGWAMADLLG